MKLVTHGMLTGGATGIMVGIAFGLKIWWFALAGAAVYAIGVLDAARRGFIWRSR